jgi:hypothetical protein
VDSKGSNTASYNDVSLAAAGAITEDSNTAATFNGTSSYLNGLTTTSVPVGATNRSVEMWFKTTSTARQALFAYGTIAAGNEFGLIMEANVQTMQAWGWGSGNDKVFNLTSPVTDGAWHQVVETYDGTSITLYIDGVALTPQAATRNTIIDASGFNIGAVVTTGDFNSGSYFNGSLDEVSLYTTALSQATVTNHYQLATATSAPVVTATGSSLAYTENATPLLDSGITITDADNTTLSSASVTMTTAYVNGEDTLAFTNQNGITGTWTAGTGVLALTGTATVANYQTALRSITYNDNSDAPSTATRTVTFTANDGTTNSATANRTITLTAVNDGPVNSVPIAQSTPGALVFSSGNSNLISISDADAGASSVQVQLVTTNGTTSLSGTGGLSFTVGDGTADGAMTFTGTVTNINLRLAGLSFTPAGYGASSLQIITSDQGNTGTGGTLTDNDTITITITDNTAPVNNLALSNISGGAYKSSNNIYYRGTALGSFTLTNTLTDAASGPASSATATMTGTSTGWTHTPSTVSTPSGGPYVSNTFSWSAATTTTPGAVVTGADVAANTAVSTLTTTLDNTAPTAGTITPDNTYTVGRSVNVAFTTGTDSGSGIATRQLQRATATLTAGSCGSYGSFIDLDIPNQTSPYTDTNVSNGHCYQYKYAVTDNVGNQDLATSANVAKVDYAAAVNATTGLVSQWRLGETTTATDTFTDTSATALASHTGQLGATWTKRLGVNAVISDANRLRISSAGEAAYYASGVPTSADYTVSADVLRKTSINDETGVLGRMDTTNANGTYYEVDYYGNGSNRWELYKRVNGTYTSLGTYAQALTANQNYRVALNMIGSAISVSVDGMIRISVTDSAISAAGRAGVLIGCSGCATASTDTTGYHLDNFSVNPAVADGKSANTGNFVGQVALGSSGAIVGDTDTAATFNGTNTRVQVLSPTGLPVGASVRSAETWFKTTSTAAQMLFNYGTEATDKEFGLFLNNGQQGMTAWGYARDYSYALTSSVTDGAWHHVVETYNGTAITLYVDGTALTPQTISPARNTVVNADGFTIGAYYGTSPGWDFLFNGSIDDVSLYNTTLSAATATNHYQLGTAPAAPVLTATGSSLAYTENGTTVLDSGITATDADTTYLTSATVTMTTAYVNGQDTLAFTNQNGITGTWTAGTGVLALTGTATVANYQTALRSITYNNNSDAPTTATRTVTFAANDGNADSNTASRTITLTAVNDAPVNTVPSSPSVYENTALVFSSGNSNLISISDVDAAAATMQVQLVSTNGTTTLSGTGGLSFSVGDGTADATMTFTGTITNINLRLAGLSFTPATNYAGGAASLQIVTSDQGNTGTGGTLTDNDTIAITVNYGLFTTAADIGAGAAGPTSSTYSSGTYTEVGNGTDIFDLTDQFHYLYKSWTGDGTIIARVTSLTNTDFYAKAGVMFRETTGIGSAHAMMAIAPTSGAGVTWSHRDSTDAATAEYGVGATAPTIWLKLVRSGNTFTGYSAQDASGSAGAWTFRGTQSVPMASTILVGLPTLSRSASVTTTATYDNVSLSAAPVLTATGSTLAYTENATPLLDSGITATDTDSTNMTSATVAMTTAYVNGQDTLAFTNQNGITGTWTAATGILALTGSATVANYQTALRSITYNNNSDNPDTTTRTVTFATNDGTADSNTASRTITLTAVADAPVVTATGSSLAYTENATPLLDSGITATDGDSANLSSATVTMTTGYVNGQDTLAFTNQNGISGTWTPGTGVLALTGSATVANYQTALRSITYNNNSDTPDTTTRTVTFATNDGSLASNTASRTITLTAVNDAPVNSVPGSQAILENTAQVFSVGNSNLISISDADAAASSVQVQLVSTNGTTTLSGTGGLSFTVGDGTADATMTFTGTTTNVNLRLAGLSFNPTTNYAGSAASLQIVTSDQGNTGTGGTLTDNDTIAITVNYGLFTTAANIGAGAAGPTSSTYSSGTYTEVGNGNDIWDAADQFHYLYKSWTGDGTIIARVTGLTNSDFNASAGVMFRETTGVASAHAYMAVKPVSGGGTGFKHRDSTGASSSESSTGGLAPTHWLKLIRSGSTFTGYRAPDSSGSPGTWTQQGTQSITMASTIIVGLATLSHNGSVTTTATYDNVSLSAPSVVTATGSSLAYTENATPLLDSGITATDADSTNLTSATVTMTTAYVNGQDTLAFSTQNGISGTWTAGTGVLALTGSATVANYQTALRSITYNNNSDNPTTTTRTVTFATSDGTADSNTASRTITLTAVADAPVVTATGSSLAYTENGTPLLDSGITTTDADSTNLTSATVTMTTAYVNGQDTLAFSTQNGISGTWTAGTGVLALTGSATVTNYQTALRSITYNNNSDNPDTTTRTVTFATSDGSLASNTASRTITLTAVNDAPVDSVPGSQTIYENTAQVFSVGNSNLISISDADAAASSVQVQLVSTNGTTTLSGTGGLSFTVGDGTADATMTFTGTTTNVNLRLAGLSFNPTTNYTGGAASLQIVTSDQGNTGTGGTLTDNDTITITVNYGLFTNTADVGAGAAGPTSSTYSSSAYTEVGNGLVINSTSDQFHYLYRSWTGDGTIIARVTALGNADLVAKAGVMFRETTGATSAHALMEVEPVGSAGGAQFVHRDSTGASTTFSGINGLQPTLWLKLVRSGNTFTGSTAPDSAGSPGAWTQQGTQSITMASTIIVGLATLSHRAGATVTAVYDNVTVS